MPSALVTGASSGIGAAFARHLASAGWSLVIVARDADRLTTQRASLTSWGAPEVEVLGADLTDPANRSAVADRLRDGGRPIELLVNNAGMALRSGFFASTDEELLHQLELNATAVLLLTHAALPGMRQRGFGGIINVASTAALVPGRSSTYGASKAWVLQFTEGLAVALKGSGVRVQALCPGFVHTEFHQRADIDMSGKPGFLYVDIDKLVTDSLADLRANRTVCIPGALYKSMNGVVKVLPRSFVRAAANWIDKRKRGPDR